MRHSSAAATGVMRNGVISSVRTTPRPTNCRLSSSASRRPSTTAMSTEPSVMTTVLSATWRNWLSVKTST